MDGSSIWLQSICLTLATVPSTDVTLLLRAPVERDLVLQPLLAHPRVDVVEPTRWRSSGLLTAGEAVGALAELDGSDPFRFLLLRGHSVCDAAAAQSSFDGRIWHYHVPVEGEDPAHLAHSGAAAHRILCQTEAIRERIGSARPELAGKTLLVPPMIPMPHQPPPSPPAGPIRRLVYSGKIAPEYCGLEMIELHERLRSEIPNIELHVAGDKIHDPPDDPTFRIRARSALEHTEGVVWHRAVSRDQVGELLRTADVAFALRHRGLDHSAELSTKILEYGAAGCPALLNPTPAHRRMLGSDYPLAATGTDEAVAVLLEASRDPEMRREARSRLEDLSREHSFERVGALLSPHLRDGTAPAPRIPDRERPRRLLIAGHRLGFAREIAARARRRGASVREDRWQAHDAHEESAAQAALAWADTVLCEWCLGNAVWYSRNKRDGQSLVVRFHRMELQTDHPAEVVFERVDAMVFVARHVLREACERFGWPDDPRLLVVPNAVDHDGLRLPKLPGAEFTLGMVGYVPWVKRLDRAVELLEHLRAHDDRYRLVVKGREPWKYEWMRAREGERRAYARVFERIERSPSLRHAIAFEPFGDDVPEFLRRVGWIVSTSEVEGHSVALAEGMASAAIPVVLERPGASDQYGHRWVHPSPAAAARAILDRRNGDELQAESRAAVELAERWSWRRAGPEWDRILGLSPAGHTPELTPPAPHTAP